MITGIMAVDPYGLIGHKNKLPWDYPKELEHFEKTTVESTIIMGHNTYDGLPKKLLRNRKGIVFSLNLEFNPKDAVVVRSYQEFINKYVDLDSNSLKYFMIGGAEIGHLFLEKNRLSSFILTKIRKSYIGDKYLNLNYFTGWDEELLESCRDYDIYKLTNNKRYNEFLQST